MKTFPGLEFTESIYAELVDALCVKEGYQEKVMAKEGENGREMVPNPVSKEEFATQVVKEYLKTQLLQGGSQIVSRNAIQAHREKYKDLVL